LNFGCDKSEAVFGSAIVDTRDLGLRKFQSYISSYFKHVADLKDDRLLVLTADLVVENAIDVYLSVIMPSYENQLSENKEFTQYLKIEVAKALKFSPSRFFESANVIRQVRNIFAHNLDIKKFSQLEPKFLRQIDEALASYGHRIRVREKTSQKFKNLTLFTTMGLTMYLTNLRMLNSFLRSENFTNIMMKSLQEDEKKK